MTGIYKITNKTNGDCYIGSSVDIFKRWYTHKTRFRYKSNLNHHLKNALNKYGLESFNFEILTTCCRENLLALEQSYIDFYKPKYNIRKVCTSNRGLKLSSDHKKKISKSLTGIKRDEAFKLKCSDNKKGMKNNWGKKLYSKKVASYDTKGNLIKVYSSTVEASKEGFSTSHISSCCRNLRKTHKNLIWKYL